MKNINNYITEKLKISKDTKLHEHNYHPKTRDELNKLLANIIAERGYEADLNDIDVSAITDMRYLFNYSRFVGNISDWDVSNVKYMEGMFNGALFNGDISDWNVSNVENMVFMFDTAVNFNQDISNWDVSHVKDMRRMFANSKFNKDISTWTIQKNCNIKDMFFDCPIEKNPPAWYK